ncbi:PH domain-containing protein [Dyadobacter chenhuakuii]|uniref:PH domain-containing protein n=1 Tax=Dyadobacter chenhuakuii TaxID=2909339 RepID=A0ABY4XRM2_9BACT|nr:PH domain-containing protein [Dyadobacter chenhuakuii]MCF2492935.1 PH domain-containing protein [Dyadobacter chenhuakuii]USJ32775.1 PH domain-containing protein [Dyadobacter chenhuakuii]
MLEAKKKTYKSEIGPELSISISGVLMIVSILLITKGGWAGLAIAALLAVFFLHLFSTTYYQILDDQLRIKSGFLMDRRIPIKSITKIVETRNPLSSPALSLNRLELKYNRYDSIMVSPKDRTHFIADLLEISEHIEVPSSYILKH